MNPRRRSGLVIVASVLMLLAGLFFATAVVLALLDLFGGTATPSANALTQSDRARAQTFSFIGLILTLPATSLLVSGALALFFHWRRARLLATIAVLYAVIALALVILVNEMQGGSASAQTAVLGAIWVMWAGFVLFSIWRRSVAVEFSSADIEEGNSRSIERR
jgi:hypothetical protein